MLVYVDTSALAKLVLQEQESESLRRWSEAKSARFVTCDLTRTELMRAVSRSNVKKVAAAHEVMRRCGFVSLDSSVYDLAGRLEPSNLRSLDAIHLAAAQCQAQVKTACAAQVKRPAPRNRNGQPDALPTAHTLP